MPSSVSLSLPSLSLKCISGCSDDPNEGPILEDGKVTTNWQSGTTLAFISSCVSSHFQFKTDATEEVSYDIPLHSAIPQFDDKYSCDLDVNKPLDGQVVQFGLAVLNKNKSFLVMFC